MIPLPQIDYRNMPNTGQDGTLGLAAPTYDRPTADGFAVAPQPDASIRCYDLDDRTYNALDPATPPDLQPGWSPDHDRAPTWERRSTP